MKLYHYTHPRKCIEILRGESSGLKYGSFALLEPQPDNWINNDYFPDFWNRLKSHMGQILLEVDVNPVSDEVIVVDRGHMVKFNSSLPGETIPSNIPPQFDHEIFEEATRAYIDSAIPIPDYMKKSNISYSLPEAMIQKTIPTKRIQVSQTQPLLEEELVDGGLIIGSEPPKEWSIEERVKVAGFYLRKIPELRDWFMKYKEKMKSELTP